MDVFVIVFEDNMVEMIDSDMIYMDHEVADTIKDNYTKSYYSAKGARKPMVRPMRVDTRTAEKMRQNQSMR